jgi:hypothetical protein
MLRVEHRDSDIHSIDPQSNCVTLELDLLFGTLFWFERPDRVMHMYTELELQLSEHEGLGINPSKQSFVNRYGNGESRILCNNQILGQSGMFGR